MHKGIITGLGGRGRYWLNQVKSYENAEMVAFVEPFAQNAKKAVEELGVPEDKIHSSLGEAIQNTPDAEFVLDVTPPGVHHEIAHQTFEAGLHLIGEKPISDDFATAKAVVEAGEKAGVVHMITQNYRWNACNRTLGKLVAEGTIGTPAQCDMQFYMNWADIPGSHYVTQPYMLINDMMVHHFDLLRFVLQSQPTAVQAITWNMPWGWHQGDAAHAIVFEFPGGLHATHVAVGCAIGQRTTYNGNWRVEGDKGSLSMTMDKIRRCWLHRLPEGQEKIDEEVENMDVPTGAAAMLDEFFDAIETKRQPECAASDNIHSVAMVFAAIKSAKVGLRVELAEL